MASAPLLAVDAPSMLYRAFYALPDSIKGADGRPVNALLGTANLVLREVEQHRPRAVVLCFGPDARDLPRRGIPRLPRRPPRGPRRPGAAVRGLSRTSSRRSAGRRHPRLARGRRPARHLRPPGGRRGRPGPDPDRRSRHVPVRDPERERALRPHRQPGRGGGGTEQVREALRDPAGPGPRLHRPARGSRRTASPAPRASARRPPRTCFGATDRSTRSWTPRFARRAQAADTLLDSGDELRAFKDMATLRDAGVTRPRDRETDRAGARRPPASAG